MFVVLSFQTSFKNVGALEISYHQTSAYLYVRNKTAVRCWLNPVKSVAFLCQVYRLFDRLLLLKLRKTFYSLWELVCLFVLFILLTRGKTSDVKHRAIAQTHFRRYRQYQVRLFFYLVFSFFLR